MKAVALPVPGSQASPPMTPLRVLRRIRKYLAVARMGFRTATAYRGEYVLRSMFLVLILYVFAVLWRTVYSATGAQIIEGFSLRDMIWYLTITESIIFARPRLAGRIDAEVKSGTLAYTLVRPFSYILFHYAQTLGESAARGLISFLIGSTAVTLLVGLPPFELASLGVFALALLLGLTIDFLLTFAVGLLAFWVEETSPFVLIHDRLLMLLGGMMLPLEIFPPLLRAVAGWLPMSMVLYAPARLLVGGGALRPASVFLAQAVWIVISATICLLVFRAGTRRVNVHGG
jgi:ABC-2 type transport system permease protein